MKLAFYNGPAADMIGTSTLFDDAIEVHQWMGGAGYSARFVHAEFVFDEYAWNGRVSNQPGDIGRSLCYSSSSRDRGVRFKQIDLTDGKWGWLAWARCRMSS